MERYKYHVIYKTTNSVNQKIYIGLHSTNNLEDNYLGSGWVLKDAIKKHGRNAFVREILHILPTREEARKKESQIVDAAFVERPDTYNLQQGGMGVEDQWGEKNPMYGKFAPNSKKVRAIHKDGAVLEATSIESLVSLIGIARNNIRALIRKQHYGRRGWKVELVG